MTNIFDKLLKETVSNLLMVQLQESLDSPVEYIMTDDTKIPENIYAAFKIENDSYAVVVNKSTIPGIYKVSVGRTPGQYFKLWSIKPNHFRKVLSTAIKVVESSIPLLGTNASGFSFQLPKDTKKNLIPLLNRIVNTSFIKSMKAVSVDNEGAATPYLFICKKNIEPKNLFHGKEFKGFNFSNQSLDGGPYAFNLKKGKFTAKPYSHAFNSMKAKVQANIKPAVQPTVSPKPLLGNNANPAETYKNMKFTFQPNLPKFSHYTKIGGSEGFFAHNDLEDVPFLIMGKDKFIYQVMGFMPKGCKVAKFKIPGYNDGKDAAVYFPYEPGAGQSTASASTPSVKSGITIGGPGLTFGGMTFTDLDTEVHDINAITTAVSQWNWKESVGSQAMDFLVALNDGKLHQVHGAIAIGCPFISAMVAGKQRSIYFPYLDKFPSKVTSPAQAMGFAKAPSDSSFVSPYYSGTSWNLKTKVDSVFNMKPYDGNENWIWQPSHGSLQTKEYKVCLQNGDIYNVEGMVSAGCPFMNVKLPGFLSGTLVYFPFVKNVPASGTSPMQAMGISGGANTDGKNFQIPADALNLVKDKKPVHKTISVDPSKQYSFSKDKKPLTLDIDNAQITTDLLDKTFDVKYTGNLKKTAEPAPVVAPPPPDPNAIKKFGTASHVYADHVLTSTVGSWKYYAAMFNSVYHETSHFPTFKKALMQKLYGWGMTQGFKDAVASFNALPETEQKVFFGKFKDYKKNEVPKLVDPSLIPKPKWDTTPDELPSSENHKAFFKKEFEEAKAKAAEPAAPVVEKPKEYYNPSELAQQIYASAEYSEPIKKTAAMIWGSAGSIKTVNDLKDWMMDDLNKPDWLDQSKWQLAKKVIPERINSGKITQETIDSFKPILTKIWTKTEKPVYTPAPINSYDSAPASWYSYTRWLGKDQENKDIVRFAASVYAPTLLSYSVLNDAQRKASYPDLQQKTKLMNDSSIYDNGEYGTGALKQFKEMTTEQFSDVMEKAWKLFSQKREEYKEARNVNGASIDLNLDFEFKNPRYAITDPLDVAESFDLSGYYNGIGTLQSDLSNKTVTSYPSPEYNAIDAYTGSSYSSMNDYLRSALNTGVPNSTYDSVKIKVKNLYKAFAHSTPLPYDMVVYRGTAIPTNNPLWDINVPLVDGGFVSTTLSASFARSWNSTTILSVILPKGCKVIVAQSISSHKSEYEIILPPLAYLKPFKVAKIGSSQYISCVYVGTAADSFVDTYLPDLLKEGFTSPEKDIIYNNMLSKVYENLGMEKDKDKKETSKFADSAFGSVDSIKSLGALVKDGTLKIVSNKFKKKNSK